MKEAGEFAEEYTAAERVRLAAVGVTIGAVVVVFGKLWLFPGLREFSESAPCLSVFGIKGTVVLFHGLFVGFPLFWAILVGCTVGRRGYKIFRDGQVPPAKEKVFRPTRIERGTKAKLLGFVHVLAAVPFIGLATWGSFEASEVEHHVQPRPANCAANIQVNRDANARPLMER